MKPLSHLLVATDFSATASRAEARAGCLAAEHGARLTLLHSLPGITLESLRGYIVQGYAQTRAQLMRHYEEDLQQQAQALAERWKIEVTPRFAVGQPHQEIIRATQETAAEMIIVGALGEHPAREFLLGSTAERAIRETRVPVLVVRGMPSAPYHRVLAALDLSLHSQSVAELACRVAPKAQYILAHAFEVPFEGKLKFAGVSPEEIARYSKEERQAARDTLHALAQKLKIASRAHVRVEHGMPESVIPKMLQETAVELVVAGKRGKSEMVDLLLGSMTKHLLLQAHCDVLIEPLHPCA